MLGISTPNPSRGAASQRARPPWMLRATALFTALLLLAQWGGLLAGADRWIAARLEMWRAAPGRDAAPLLVVIDESTIATFGPPPWSAATWYGILAELHTAGIEQVTLVDPWTTLLEPAQPDDAPADPTRARALLRVPRLVLESSDAPGLPRLLEPPTDGPFAAWDHHLSLPAYPDGVVRDLTDAANASGVFGPSAFCVWNGRCPSGGPLALWVRTQGEGAGLPAISLADLVRGARVPVSEDASRTTLLGVTDPWRARTVRVGPEAELRTWPEAIGSAITSARSTLPTPRPGPGGELLLIVFTVLLSIGLTRMERRAERESVLVWTPIGVALLALLATAAHVVVAPLTGIVLAAALPPALSAVGSRRVARRFLRSVALLLAQDGIRYAWRDTRIRTREELAQKLADLLAPRFPGYRSGYLHLGRRGRVGWTVTPGGMGPEDMALVGRRERQRLLELAATHDTGARADVLRADPGGLRLMPVRDGRELVGYWLVGWPQDFAEPDPLVLADLARWCGRHLALYEGMGPRQWRERLRDRLESDTEAVRRLFNSASEERRRQVQALHALDLPLLTTDLAGTLQFANQAMTELLTGSQLGAVSTLAELIARLDPEDRTHDLRRLLLTGEPLTLRWRHGAHGWLATAQAVSRPTEDASEEVLGYVLWARDLTASQQLEQMRASVLGFASNRVRNALMVVMGYARMLEGQMGDERARKMLENIVRNADDVATALDELKSLAGLEEEPDRLLELDFGRLVREAINDALWFAEQHRVELVADIPDISLPVLAPAGRARDTLDLLLDLAILSASPGSQVSVQVEERREDTLFTLSWSGPGFDPAILAVAKGPWHEDIGSLPRALRPYARARAVFTDLVVRSAPGEGVEVQFSSARAGRP